MRFGRRCAPISFAGMCVGVDVVHMGTGVKEQQLTIHLCSSLQQYLLEIAVAFI